MRISDWSSDVCSSDLVQDEVCADDIIVTGTVVDVRLRQGASEISAGRVVELSSDSIADALAFEPSVNATPRYGVVDQLFLITRGSGRHRRTSARGCSILIHDVPINRGEMGRPCRGNTVCEAMYVWGEA